METLTHQAIAISLISLRFAPAFAFAAPFTLVRVPAVIRVLLSISLSIWLVHAYPESTWLRVTDDAPYLMMAAGELFAGLTLALSLQWAHGAILTAGRAIDIQAGYGLALLIDPTSRAQIPLMGTIFAYAAGAVFFALNGPMDFLAIVAGSLERMPLGAVTMQPNLSVFMAYLTSVFLIALGLAGTVLLTLFMIDLTVAFLSRTLPQMNVLLIGFQVKTLAVLATLPLAISLSGTLYVRLVRLSLETAGRML